TISSLSRSRSAWLRAGDTVSPNVGTYCRRRTNGVARLFRLEARGVSHIYFEEFALPHAYAECARFYQTDLESRVGHHRIIDFDRTLPDQALCLCPRGETCP